MGAAVINFQRPQQVVGIGVFRICLHDATQRNATQRNATQQNKTTDKTNLCGHDVDLRLFVDDAVDVGRRSFEDGMASSPSIVVVVNTEERTNEPTKE